MIGVALFLVFRRYLRPRPELPQLERGAPASWAGVQNWISIFKYDDAGHSLGVTAHYVLLNIPAQTVLALGLAVMLNRKRIGDMAFSGSCTWPPSVNPGGHGRDLVLGVPTADGVNQSVLHTLFGISGPLAELVQLGHARGGGGQYLAVPRFQHALLFRRAAGIPRSIYEAAEIDGASKWRQFWRISLPLLNPTMLFVLVTDVIGSFQVFDTLYVLTAGWSGRLDEGDEPDIYDVGFTDYRLGEAAALSVLLFGVILIFSVGQFMFFRKRTTYDYSS